jgi:hypothetical protein
MIVQPSPAGPAAWKICPSGSVSRLEDGGDRRLVLLFGAAGEMMDDAESHSSSSFRGS